MSAPTHPPLTTPLARHLLARPGAVAAAIGIALAAWAIATQAGGLDLQSPAFSAATHPASVGAGLTAVAAALAGLAAWTLLAILERTTRRPRRTWTTIAVAALIVSLGAPLSGHGITGTDRAMLACLHLLVATTLIILLGRTAAPAPPRENKRTIRKKPGPDDPAHHPSPAQRFDPS